MQARGQQGILVFEHIPKTGGITLRNILWRVYGGPAVFILEDPQRIREHLALLAAALGQRWRKVRVVIDHVGYKVHEEFPAGFRYEHFTILRDPVERTISQYYYHIQRGSLDPAVSLEEFLERDPRDTWNWQTAFLGGLVLDARLHGRELTPERFNSSLLEAAKETLRNCRAVGILEHFDESVLLFGRVFGWRSWQLCYTRQNVGTRRPQGQEVPKGTRAAVEAYNRLDLELYDYGVRLFREQLGQWLPDLPRELERFRRLNIAFARIWPVAYPLARPVARGLRVVASRLSG